MLFHVAFPREPDVPDEIARGGGRGLPPARSSLDPHPLWVPPAPPTRSKARGVWPQLIHRLILPELPIILAEAPISGEFNAVLSTAAGNYSICKHLIFPGTSAMIRCNGEYFRTGRRRM
jgi:hypothetical protein